MRIHRLFRSALVAAFSLSACTSNSTLSGPPVSVRPGRAQAAAAKPGPTLYALNSSLGSSFDVSVYSGGGARYLRSVPGEQARVGSLAVQDPLLYFGYTKPSLGPGLLNVYSSRGAKFVRQLGQSQPFGLLTLDPSGNLYTICSGDKVCEYAHAKQHLIRKIAFGKFGFTFYALATDPAGDLAASSMQTGSMQTGVLVFAPGQKIPYWTINENGIYGIAFDSVGDLFVGTCCNPTKVEMYPPGAQTPTRTITAGLTNSLFLALDTNDTLYVLNRGVVQHGQCSEPTSITVYPQGSTEPSRTISDGLQCDASRMLAVDASGNIYVPNDYTTTNAAGNVVVYGPDSDSPMLTVTKHVVNPVAVGIGQ